MLLLASTTSELNASFLSCAKNRNSQNTFSIELIELIEPAFFVISWYQNFPPSHRRYDLNEIVLSHTHTPNPIGPGLACQNENPVRPRG